VYLLETIALGSDEATVFMFSVAGAFSPWQVVFMAGSFTSAKDGTQSSDSLLTDP
jgi:hypothetical protein